MFPAGRKDNGRRAQSETGESLHDRTRFAVHQTAAKTYERRTAETTKEKNDSVPTQFGFGESDSEDDLGGVSVVQSTAQVMEVFVAPEKRKDDNSRAMRAQRAERQQEENPMLTFPTSASRISLYSHLHSESSGTTSRKEVKEEEVSSDDSSSYASTSRREKRSKKKKRKRSRSRSRESYRRRSPPPKKIHSSKPDFNFVTDQEYFMAKSGDHFSRNFLVRDTHYDPENASLGNKPKEIPKMNTEARVICGLECKPNSFERNYPVEVASKGSKNSQSFSDKLAAASKIVPSETFFRRPASSTVDCWKIGEYKDVLNKNNDDEEQILLEDNKLSELEGYHKRMREHKNDVEAVLKYVELKDELEAAKVGKYQNNDLKGLYDRHMGIVQLATSYNRKSVDLQLKEVEYKIKLSKAPADIISHYNTIAHNFPHEPMVWVQMLDYIQYNVAAYSYETMLKTFKECFVKLQGLNDRTLLSHVNMVTDSPALQKFHIHIYVRFLKWLIACGHVPLAIANLQATFEMNFGFGKVTNLTFQHVLPQLREFWETCLPRIGDDGGLGGAATRKKNGARNQEDIEDLETVKFETLLTETVLAVKNELHRVRNLDESLVSFERIMLDVDTRPKRTQLVNCKTYTEETESDTLGIEFWKSVDFEMLTPFFDSHATGIPPFVQPFLEVLGIVFSASTNQFSLTEHIIEEWRGHGLICLENHQEIDLVPTYSENTLLEYGRNFLHFLIKKRGEQLKQTTGVMDQELLKFLVAQILTETYQFERRSQEEKNGQFFFYRLRLNHFESFFNLVSENHDSPYSEVLKEQPHILPVLRCVLAEKLVSWWEKGVEQRDDILKNEKVAVQYGHSITGGDKKAFNKIKMKLYTYLDQVAPQIVEGKTSFLKNKRESLASFQLHLYANILRARLCFEDDDAIRIILASEILEKSMQNAKEIMKRDDFVSLMQESVSEIVDTVYEKEEMKEKTTIPQLPRAGALAEALQTVVDFALLGSIASKRQTVEDNVQKVFKKCDLFKDLQKSFNRLEEDKEKDKRDTQFLLDTIIILLSRSNPSVGFMEFYKQVVAKAADVFPRETKYAKLFTDLYAGSIVKNIELGQIVIKKNDELLEKRNRRFDEDIERTLLMNSLASVFSAVQISGRVAGGNDRMKYNKFQKEAETSRDPALWRLALKAAGHVDKVKLLENEAYVRAQNQCSWSLNMHIDFIEAMSPHPKTATREDSLLYKTMAHLTKDAKKHNLFVENYDILEAFYDVANSKEQYTEN